MELGATKTNLKNMFLISFPHKASFVLYCTSKMDLSSEKKQKTLMVLFVFETQTFIFVVLYKKCNFYNQKCCTVQKKNKKNNVSRPMALDAGPSQPGPLANGLETLFFFLFFLVQYNTFA